MAGDVEVPEDLGVEEWKTAGIPGAWKVWCSREVNDGEGEER